MSLNSNEPRSWDFTSGYNEKKKMIKKNIDLIVSIYRARLSKVSKFRR